MSCKHDDIMTFQIQNFVSFDLMRSKLPFSFVFRNKIVAELSHAVHSADETSRKGLIEEKYCEKKTIYSQWNC